MLKFTTRKAGEKFIKGMRTYGLEGSGAFNSRPVKNASGQWVASFKGGTLSRKHSK